MKTTSYLQSVQIKPYPFSADDKYISISPSLGIDIALKKKLAPNKPIPIYNAAKLLSKYNKRNRIFGFWNNLFLTSWLVPKALLNNTTFSDNALSFVQVKMRSFWQKHTLKHTSKTNTKEWSKKGGPYNISVLWMLTLSFIQVYASSIITMMDQSTTQMDNYNVRKRT